MNMRKRLKDKKIRVGECFHDWQRLVLYKASLRPHPLHPTQKRNDCSINPFKTCVLGLPNYFCIYIILCTYHKNNQLILHDGRSITIIKNSCSFSNVHLIFWLWISRVLSRPTVSKLFQAKGLNVTYSYRNKIIASINRMTCSRFSKILMMLRTDGRYCTRLVNITVTVCLSGHTQALCLSLASSLMVLHHGSYPFLSSISVPSLYDREKTEVFSYHLSQIQGSPQTLTYLSRFFLFTLLFSILRLVPFLFKGNPPFSA